MKYLLLNILILSLIIISCKKEDDSLNLELINSLEGNWELDTFMDSIQIMKRTKVLVEDNYGFSFESNGNIILNDNAGGCGTPPITYARYNGKWISIAEKIFEIKVGYWGGTSIYQMHIIEISNNEVKVFNKYE